MTTPPVLSVVIPCYNAAAFLAGSVGSVLAQGVAQVEILIVDDVSTDDSVAAAEALTRAHPEVRLIRRHVNGGPGAARNDGLRAAAGRYVCFLDADDEYAPGCFEYVLSRLDADPAVGVAITGIELLDCQHTVHSDQLQLVAASLPGNVILRRAIVDLIGGFSEDPAFRGTYAGEDVAFRKVLGRWFRFTRVERPFFRYRARPGSHFERFLERCSFVEGKLQVAELPPTEENRATAAAYLRYLARVQDRIESVATMKEVPVSLTHLVAHALASVEGFDEWRDRLEGIPGYLYPHEGYALFLWARDGPGPGAIVEVGSLYGRSTCWLAAGSKARGREKIVAVDHFQGSPEHGAKASHRVPGLEEVRSTLPDFLANLEKQNLRDWVEPRVGSSLEIAAGWTGPIRLLFIDADHSYESVRADFEAWSRHLTPDAIVAFHDVGPWPGVTRFYQELCRDPRVREVGNVRTLRFVQRLRI